MKAVRIDLPVELHQYLLTVLKRYSNAGIDPEEGLILFHTWDFVSKQAQMIELVEPTPPVPSVLPQPTAIDTEMQHSDGS